MMKVNRTVAVVQDFELIMNFYDYEKRLNELMKIQPYYHFASEDINLAQGQINKFIILLVCTFLSFLELDLVPIHFH